MRISGLVDVQAPLHDHFYTGGRQSLHVYLVNSLTASIR